jgi:hypothetical protein
LKASMEDLFHTEQDLQRLIGQYESLRLDFKASALLSQPTDRIVKQLTEDVSAFVNTEGGLIVIGIKEGKSGRKSVGVEIDEGVDPAGMPPERLEQLIASNISPSVPGLVVRPVPLSGNKTGRVAYVVIVPKGTTAHQARQLHKYLGRTEFAAVPLEDHVVRLLMTRKKAPHAVIEISEVLHFSADEEFKNHRARLEADQKAGILIRPERRAILEAPMGVTDQIGFGFQIRNDGAITIRDCALSLSYRSSDSRQTVGLALRNGPALFEFSAQNRAVRKTTGTAGWQAEEERSGLARLYPQQVMVFPGARVWISFPTGDPIQARSLGMVEWKLFLDDAPFVSGSIDLGDEIASKRVTLKSTEERPSVIRSATT